MYINESAFRLFAHTDVTAYDLWVRREEASGGVGADLFAMRHEPPAFWSLAKEESRLAHDIAEFF